MTLDAPNSIYMFLNSFKVKWPWSCLRHFLSQYYLFGNIKRRKCILKELLSFSAFNHYELAYDKCCQDMKSTLYLVFKQSLLRNTSLIQVIPRIYTMLVSDTRMR